MPIDVMANPPQHDFAPAWLNFSTQQKPNKAHHDYDLYHHHHHHGRQERNSRSHDPPEGYRLGNQRHYSSESQLEFAGPVPPAPAHHVGYGYRGRDDQRHYPPEGFTRHHSLDDDRYHYYHGDPPGYPPGAQIWRGGYHRQESIYQHPNSRYCGNGSYPVPVPGNNYHGNRGGNGGRQRYNSGSRNGYHERGRQDSIEEPLVGANGQEIEMENEVSNNNNSVDTEEKFQQDFPSLGGDGGIGSKDAQSSKLAGVWDKPLNSKIHTIGGRRMQLIQKPLRNENNDTNTISINHSGAGDNAGHHKLNPHAGIVNQANKTATSNAASSSIYKSLVPSKGNTKSASRKSSTSVVKESNHKPAVNTPSHSKPPPTFIPAASQSFTKEQTPQRPASTPPMEILNPRLVIAQTKKIDKKSDFLKELRKSGYNNNRDDEMKDCSIEGENPQENGTNDVFVNEDINMREVDDVNSVEDVDMLDVNYLENLTISPGSSPMPAELSSSLEAERRLLREMGWQEDIDEKPLTEDELKEFQASITATKLDTKPSKLRNGFNHNLISKWSPVRNINNIDGLNDSASSCSDTSDDEAIP